MSVSGMMLDFGVFIKKACTQYARNLVQNKKVGSQYRQPLEFPGAEAGIRL